MADALPDPRAVRAAVANVAWCESVCRGHGIPGSVTHGMWLAGGRPPPFFPDVVTLAPGLEAAAVAEAVPRRDGASVKDSFGDVDLGGHGLAVLFEAEWVWHEAAPPGGESSPAEGSLPAGSSPAESPAWAEVVDEAALEEWAAASSQAGTFPPALLADPSVRFITARGAGEVVGRAALCLGAGVVGVSNVWAGGSGVWETLGGAASRLFPGRPVGGYERGADLAEAVAAGFVPVGRLRVWVRR
ncbi:hypothetical protein ACFP55_15910 [Knoellia sp. GCM10027112]